MQTSGDVRVEEVYLTTTLGEHLDLSNFLLELSLTESIHQPCLFGSALITDAANILGTLFTGNEMITFKLRTPYLEESPETIIHKTFSVYSVTDRTLDNDRQQFYKVHFMSLEGQADSITRFNKKYSGGTEAIASEIFEEIAEPRTVKGGDKSEMMLYDIPHATNNFEFISTYWSPFKCLNYLAKNSIGQSLKMPNVMFFESNKRYYFTSISSLVQQQKDAKTLYDEYSYISVLDEGLDNSRDSRRGGSVKYTSPFESNQMITVSNVEYPVYYDELENRMSGYYGNTTFAYDFANKDMYDIRFDYTLQHEERQQELKNLLPDTFTTFKHITNTAPFSEDIISDPLSVINFKAGASGLFGENDAFNVNQVTATSFRNTAMAELDAVKYEITVPGKTDVELGRLIRFNYPNVGDRATNPSLDSLFDPKISGVYIITGIRHSISATREHEMVLEIVRDSVGDEE